jgi:hypothetical protein
MVANLNNGHVLKIKANLPLKRQVEPPISKKETQNSSMQNSSMMKTNHPLVIEKTAITFANKQVLTKKVAEPVFSPKKLK